MAELMRNVRHLSGLDIEGGGQIVVAGEYAFVGHMQPPHGTSIIDVSDPTRPLVKAHIDTGSAWSHTHKVRVCGDIMVTNVEQDRRSLLRNGQRWYESHARLSTALGREPDADEMAAELGIDVADLAAVQAAAVRGYDEGGFKVWDISDRGAPKLLSYQKTFGVGVHRFDMDERYVYISTEMEGYLGNILVIYDISTPQRPEEVSRWCLPGQHLAGGESPAWEGLDHRLHHALRVGDELWASLWHGGFRTIDISDIRNPVTIAEYDYHPWVVEPTHTTLPADKLIGGRRIAVVADEEHSHRHGQPHAGLWIFDITELDNIHPLATFHVSEMDSPWARAAGRFGMHQFQEHLRSSEVYCAWFSGGLRVVDIAVPSEPREIAFFIPPPRAGQPSPQSNDVELDKRGLVYLLDRNKGLDILEMSR